VLKKAYSFLLAKKSGFKQLQVYFSNHHTEIPTVCLTYSLHENFIFMYQSEKNFAKMEKAVLF